MVKITIGERGHHLLEMLAWLREQDIEEGSEWVWERDIRENNIDLHFYFREGCDKTAALFALKFVK